LISGKLSAKQQSVFVLHDLEDFSQEEISAILEMPKKQCKKQFVPRQESHQANAAMDRKY
jgi:DNA-directed RNA polymerase specialized sigma24 family protein